MTSGPQEPSRDEARSKCGARKRDGSGGTCTLPAGWGTDHVGIGACKLHGGRMPNHQKAAKAEQARRAVVTYGLPREIDPAQALIEEVHRTAGAVSWLGAIVARTDEDDLVWGVAEETERPPSFGDDGELRGGTETKRKAAPSVWLQLYQAERKHLVNVSREALGADAAGRVAAVFEQIGATYVALLERVLERLELTEEQRAMVPEVVQGELLAIAEGGGGDG